MLEGHPRTISRISKKRTWLIEQDRKGVPKEIKRPLYAKFPAIDNIVTEFKKFARSQRLPVTLRLIQGRARKEADTRGTLNFHASRGWVEKFLRRSPVQPSFRLHGTGDVTLPTYHAERMQEIRKISSQYQIKISGIWTNQVYSTVTDHVDRISPTMKIDLWLLGRNCKLTSNIYLL